MSLIPLPELFHPTPPQNTVDTSRAGKGDLDVGVNVNNRNVPFEMDSGRQRDNFEVSFLAQEAGTHRIPISFNGDPVQGKTDSSVVGRPVNSGYEN